MSGQESQTVPGSASLMSDAWLFVTYNANMYIMGTMYHGPCRFPEWTDGSVLLRVESVYIPV